MLLEWETVIEYQYNVDKAGYISNNMMIYLDFLVI
jgi:hypothetical protein